MPLKTKFDELLEFPCKFSFKVMGLAQPQMTSDVLSVIQKHAPGDYSPQITPSSKGTYQSVSIPVIVNSKKHIESIYTDLNALELVRCII